MTTSLTRASQVIVFKWLVSTVACLPRRTASQAARSGKYHTVVDVLFCFSFCYGYFLISELLQFQFLSAH